MLVGVCVAGTVTRLVDASAIAAASAEADGSDSAGAIAASAETDGSDCGDVVGSASPETSSEAFGASSFDGVISTASAETLPPFAGSATANTGVNARSRLSSMDTSAVPTKHLLSFSILIIVHHQPSGSRDDNRRRLWLRPNGFRASSAVRGHDSICGLAVWVTAACQAGLRAKRKSGWCSENNQKRELDFKRVLLIELSVVTFRVFNTSIRRSKAPQS